MAQLTSAAPRATLRATPGLLERIDLPRRITFTAAASMIGIVVVLMSFIAWQGLQLFLQSGISPSVIFSPTWNLDAGQYGMAPFIAGTVAVVLLALAISTPLSVGLAVFLSEIAPQWARRIVQPALEIFVGIPSVVWGFLGATILAPFLADTLPYRHHLVLSLPGIGTIFDMPGFLSGKSWLAGALVLSAMVLPTITSVAYDALRAIPAELRTGSLALGTTRWQMIRHILIPAALPGLLTAVVLGMTRAAGEALAVQMAIGNSGVLPSALTAPISTLTAWLTMNIGETVPGSTEQNAYWTMSLILLLISVSSVVLVRLINRRRLGS